MNESDIRYIFDSKELYPVSNDFVAEFITAPKKISVKKMIEQNNLIEITDYIVNANGYYNFTLNAFKFCVINYRLKFVKLFLDVEKTIINEIMNSYKDEISKLNNIISEYNKEKNNVVSVDTNTITPIIIDKSANTDTLIINQTFNQSTDIVLDKISNIEKNINTISDKLDTFIKSDILNKLDSYSKKVNIM